MSLERILTPALLDFHYFDEIFEETHREVAKMHQDMRSAMLRITPPDQLMEGNNSHTQRVEAFRRTVTTNEDGSREFLLKLDVSTFKPEEIVLKTDGNELSIEAKHEEKSDTSRVFHQFSRHYTLPEGTVTDALASTLSKDGVLTVKAPVTADNAIEGPAAKKPALEIQ
ncbi:protein lethal(2)essential for life-like [Haliotis rubra]|uniref:protein lethal(2)essential for life-like n=1 Tax=Haliotis rubra TaxID=36100 RepID=UPI001EE58316|nr:protein lethal(2)essential for life-like [Haliotis rubra]